MDFKILKIPREPHTPAWSRRWPLNTSLDPHSGDVRLRTTDAWSLGKPLRLEKPSFIEPGA